LQWKPENDTDNDIGQLFFHKMIENVNVCDTLDDRYHFVIECILFND